MTVHTLVLSFVVDVALGAWLGTMAFFSFVGAPRAFAVFGEDGGAYVNDVFPRYYRVGVGLGSVTFLAGVALGYVSGFSGPVLALLPLVAIAVLLAGYSVRTLVPKMEDAGEAGFRRYHRRSVVLNGVMLLAVTLALVASHLPS